MRKTKETHDELRYESDGRAMRDYITFTWIHPYLPFQMFIDANTPCLGNLTVSQTIHVSEWLASTAKRHGAKG